MKTINKETTQELIIKNSKFIGSIHNFYDNSDIEEILKQIKEKYPKATHYCYGYITENKKKASDDGEPGGTAGIPILNVLEKENMINVIVIVIRYFGGIKLGAGGLVRAYSKTVKETLNIAQKVEVIEGIEIEISAPYNKQKDLDYILKNSEIINKEFNETIKYNVLIKKEHLDKFKNYNPKIIKSLLIKKEQL